MPDMKATLKQSRIVDLEIRSDLKTKGLTLQANLSAQYRKPIEADDKTGLIILQVIVTSDDSKEFYLSVTEELIFEFDQVPEVFDQAAREACIPVALNDLSDRIDCILNSMEQSPIHLSKGFSL